MNKIFSLLFFAFLGLNNINSATFTSVSSGTWSTPATWTRVGVDADGIPDSDDDVTISGGHTIVLGVLGNSFKTLTVAAGGVLNVNGKALTAYGNMTNNGNIIGPYYFLRFSAPGTLSSSTTFTNSGVWYASSNLTITAGTVIKKPNNFNLSASAIVTNLGSVTLTAGTINFSGTSSWVNGANSYLSVGANISGTYSMNCSASGNTVVYNTGCVRVPPNTYYNLTLSSTSSATKIASGDFTILNDFTLTSGPNNVFDLNNHNFTIAGNWSNLANKNVLNQGIITFNGSGTQTLSRASNLIINKMVLNGTGTVLLARGLDVSQSLTINSGTFDVSASNFQVNLAGNLINNSSINSRQGIFNFNGTSAQTISGTTNTNFYDVTSANAAGVTVTSNATISNLLRVNSGSFGTSGAGVLTIPATGATTYGRIAAVGGSLIGNGWDIKGYIDAPAPKGWQYLSSPINGNTLADWDNDPRFYMSGVGGNDGSAAGFYSVRTYNEVSGNYIDITTTSTPLTAGKGFMVWMSDNNTTGLTSPLIYNSAGIPNFGNKSFPVTAGGAGSGYNLVGNPYACPITYSTVVAASGNLFSSFVILLEDGSYVTDPNGGIIGPNQGFMCVATSNGSISFTEAAKNIVSTPNLLRTINPTKSNLITFSVYNNVNGLGGQTNLEFNESAKDLFENDQDLSFLTSPFKDADNIWTKSSDFKPLLKNTLNSNEEEKDVPLTVKVGVYGKHTISAKGLANFNSYNTVWIEDVATGNKADLLKDQSFDFDATEINKEYNFIVHFSNAKKSSVSDKTIVSNLLNENTSVYNTPSNVIVKFDMKESTPVTISVYNLTGQKVMESINANVINDRIALPIQKENGLYLLVIQSGDQQITRKIIY